MNLNPYSEYPSLLDYLESISYMGDENEDWSMDSLPDVFDIEDEDELVKALLAKWLSLFRMMNENRSWEMKDAAGRQTLLKSLFTKQEITARYSKEDFPCSHGPTFSDKEKAILNKLRKKNGLPLID